MSDAGPRDIPRLQTFTQLASWQNRAGRIDRSACVELKASDLWRSIPPEAPPPEGWQKTTRKRQGKSHRLAQTQVIVSAYDLQALHDNKPPFTLQGDQRTTKSNALRNQPSPPKPTFSERGPSSGGNPNRGQSRTKLLGLPTTWSQTLTLQRWQMHARLQQHFFACPRCNDRALKLFLPLCTEQELHDALTAKLWLDSNQKRIATSSTLRPEASSLLSRYAVLFPPRSLLCRKCLGLRYGEVRT